MRRREFMAGLGSAAAWPPAARAQQAAMPVVGVLHAGSPGLIWDDWTALRDGLKEAGYVEGQNVVLEFRWANWQSAQLSGLANDLVQRNVAAIIAVGGMAAVQAAKSATSTIPILAVNGGDLVKSGFAASLNRPGANITGVTAFSGDLMGKQVALLHELLPHVLTFAFLWNRISDGFTSDVLSAASSIGLQAFVVTAGGAPPFEAAFATLVQRQASALLVGDTGEVGRNAEKLVALAAQHKIPAIYPGSEFVRAGGLMSYGSNLKEVRQIAVHYLVLILKGAKPADLPIQQPTKFELAINLQTAKALGLTIPETLLATADEVIQ
jgi:putative tryptophan/tyrosine transport system substrate-binding protein